MSPVSLDFLDCKAFTSAKNTELDLNSAREISGESAPAIFAHPSFTIPPVANVKHTFPQSFIQLMRVFIILFEMNDGFAVTTACRVSKISNQYRS